MTLRQSPQFTLRRHAAPTLRNAAPGSAVYAAPERCARTLRPLVPGATWQRGRWTLRPTLRRKNAVRHTGPEDSHTQESCGSLSCVWRSLSGPPTAKATLVGIAAHNREVMALDGQSARTRFSPPARNVNVRGARLSGGKSVKPSPSWGCNSQEEVR